MLTVFSATPQLGGNVLAEQTVNYQSKDLPFTRSKRGVPLLEHGVVLSLLSPVPASLHWMLNRIQKILILVRPGEQFHRARFHRVHARRNVAAAGDKDRCKTFHSF